MIKKYNNYLKEALDDKLDKGTKKLVDDISTLSYEEVKEILEYGVDDINYMEDYIFSVACRDCDLKIVQLLIDNGSNIKTNGDYILKRACYDGNYDLVKLLLDNGCNPNNYNAIHYARSKGHNDIVDLLEDYSEQHKNLINIIRKIKSKYDKKI